MAAFLDDPETLESTNQHVFNMAVWEQVLDDEFLCGLPNRIETDELGQVVMSPPPTPEHGEDQSNIVVLLRILMHGGSVITECPVSTSGGVKGVDVVWISDARRDPQRGQVCLTHAPEICIEVVSRNNSRRELKEKKRLYFEAGAEEVWLCQRDRRMVFFTKDAPELEGKRSTLCPKFPEQVA